MSKEKEMIKCIKRKETLHLPKTCTIQLLSKNDDCVEQIRPMKFTGKKYDLNESMNMRNERRFH